MTHIAASRDALAKALRPHLRGATTLSGKTVECDCGERFPANGDGGAAQAGHAIDALIASGAVIDAATLADEIAKSFPYNGELRRDGSEDPQAAAYVEGLRDAWQIVKNAAALTERTR